MARTEDPREQAGTSLPKQRQESETLATTPRITVVGYMKSQIAIRLSWKAGMVTISQSRFRFLRDDLGMDVDDNPAHYLF